MMETLATSSRLRTSLRRARPAFKSPHTQLLPVEYFVVAEPRSIGFNPQAPLTTPTSSNRQPS
jgi:hypothetical protein